MTNTKTHYIVQTASTRCAAKFGIYRKVAVLEVEEGLEQVSMISERARGCVRVVDMWDRLNVGKTSACAYRVALAEARAMVAELNGVQA